jgi:hypothetical protein
VTGSHGVKVGQAQLGLPGVKKERAEQAGESFRPKASSMRLFWFGWFVEVDFIRLWAGHGVTP